MTDRATLTPGEAAHTLGVSERTVRRLTADGTIRAVHIGRRVVIPTTEIDRILGDHPAGA